MKGGGGEDDLNIWLFIFYFVTIRAKGKKNRILKILKFLKGLEIFEKAKIRLNAIYFHPLLNILLQGYFLSPQNYKFVSQINFSERNISFVLLQQLHHGAYFAIELP